ncbi:MAG: DUF2341 domain-containing protein [Candidatus Marsarchaeota archaeon]|jgi:hypothetical protein|nr:DUF2341 domain-containing protein [Candidatus Marsarchaeota archaeon]
MKAQSAMEYLMTYGWAILIISIVLAALFALGLFSPATFIHNTCIFPAGFSCLNTEMDSGGNFTINLEQSTSSPINITAIGCNSNATTSHMVSFLSNPISLQIGANVTIFGNATTRLRCWTNSTPFTGRIGSVFNGYLVMNYTDMQSGFPHTVFALLTQKVLQPVISVPGQYTTTSSTTVQTTVSTSTVLTTISTISTTLSTTISTISTTLSTTLSTTVSTTISTTVTTISTIYYVPITLTNSQSAATPAPFQQLIVVPSSTYSSYINSAWSNVQFTTGAGNTGTVLQAWIEDNASNTAAHTTIWVKLPNGIGASSGTTIYMNFLPSAVLSSSGPTGEAPQLSSTYGQYDNGADVFSMYWNFAGTSLPAGLTEAVSGGGSVTVNNGLTLNDEASSSSYAIVYSSSTLSDPTVIDAWLTGSSTYGIQLGETTESGVYSGYETPYYTYEYATEHTQIYYIGDGTNSYYPSSGTGGYTLPEVATFVWNTTGWEQAMRNYSDEIQWANTNYAPPSTYYLTVFEGGSWVYGYGTITWLRERAYPPNGVMPSVSFGSVA